MVIVIALRGVDYSVVILRNHVRGVPRAAVVAARVVLRRGAVVICDVVLVGELESHVHVRPWKVAVVLDISLDGRVLCLPLDVRPVRGRGDASREGADDRYIVCY